MPTPMSPIEIIATVALAIVMEVGASVFSRYGREMRSDYRGKYCLSDPAARVHHSYSFAMSGRLAGERSLGSPHCQK